jgi:hypothetical protein
LRLLDDERSALQHAAGQLLDRLLGAVVRHGLDECETARPSSLAVESNANAANLDRFAGERLLELLLVDVVRKIADEKAGTHCAAFPLPSFSWPLL